MVVMDSISQPGAKPASTSREMMASLARQVCHTASTQGSNIPALPRDDTPDRITSAVATNQILPQEKIVSMSHTTNHASVSPPSRTGRRNIRFIPLVSAVSLMLIAVTASSFAQEAQTTLVPPTRPAVSSDWKRMMEGLKRAKPMPEPPSGVRPNTATPSGDMRRFDALTGRSFKVASSRIAAAPLGAQQERGRAGAVPTSPGGGQTINLAPNPEAVFDAIASANGVTPADITPTPPAPLTIPYFAPFNQEFELLMRFPVAGFDDQFYLCSATAISDFHLLSAGHCVYNHDPLGDGSGLGAGFAAEMWAWPAQTDVVDPPYPNGWTDFPYGVAKMTFQTTYNAWIDNSDFNWDMSFISVDRRIGDHTGWPAREWGVVATGLLFDGYPAEPPYVPPDNPFQYIGFDDNNVTGYTCCRISMDAFVYGGHSGGGVFHFTNSQFTLQGVNSTSNRHGLAEATRFTAQTNADLVNTIATDQSVRPPADRAQLIEYVFNDNSKGLIDTSVAIGSSFRFTLNGFNAGYIPSGTVGASIYLTKFPFDHGLTEGTFVGLVTLGNLDAFQFTVQNGSVTVPSFIQPGLYYVGWVLNGDNFQYDTDDHSAIITKSLLTVVGLNAVLTNPNTVVGGSTSTGTVQLTSAAPSAGMDIVLSSSDRAVQIPNLVHVPAGAASATFTLKTAAVAKDTVSIIAGNISGVPNIIRSTSIDVKPASLKAVTLAPSSVVGSKTSTATAALNGPAQAGGITISLSSSSVSAQVPASVHVNAGAISATFSIATSVVSSLTTASIKATQSGVSKTATLTIHPVTEPTAVTLSPSTLTGGSNSTAKVQIGGPAPRGGVDMSLSSSDVHAKVPATVHINAGSFSTTVTVTTSSGAATVTATIKATQSGVSKTATLTIKPTPQPTAVTLSPSTLLGGSNSTATVKINGPAPTGGADISLSSSNVHAKVPATVHINAGSSSTTVTVTTSAGAATVTAVIKAACSGVAKSATLTILNAL